MTERNCGNCACWRPMAQGSFDGACGYHPPLPVMIGGTVHAARPATTRDDFCQTGWRPRQAGNNHEHREAPP